MESRERIDPVAFLRDNPPERMGSRTAIQDWEPVLIQLINLGLGFPDIERWVLKHHQTLGLGAPTSHTLKKWLTETRDKIGKPLRRRNNRKDPGNKTSRIPKIKNIPLPNPDNFPAEDVNPKNEILPEDTIRSDGRSAEPDQLESIKHLRQQLPLDDRQQWGADLLLLQIKEFNLIEKAQPNSVDIADMKKGHDNLWRKLCKTRRLAE